MARRTTLQPAAPPKVDVSVSIPPNSAAAAPPAEEKPPTWFWDLLAEIPTDQWGRKYSILGWRQEPRVPGLPGAKGFLFELMEPITISYFKQNYGGGKFRCVLQENGRFKTTHDFDIEGTPKYDLTRENPNGIAAPAVPAAGNAGTTELLQQFVGVLRDELRNAREANAATPAGQDKVVDMLTTASQKAIDIVTRQTPQALDQTAQLKNLADVIKAFAPATAAAPPQKSLMEQFIELLSNPVVGPILLDLIKPKNPLDQLTQVNGLIEAIDKLRGGNTGGTSKSGDWKNELVSGLVQRGPEILEKAGDLLEKNRLAATERRAAAEAQLRTVEIARSMPAPGAPGMPPANGTVPVVPFVPPASAMPAAQPRVVPIHVEPIDVPVTPATPPPAAAEGMSTSESDAVAKFMKQKIVAFVKAGRAADDVVDFIEDVDPAVNTLLVENSPQIVTMFIQGDPILKELTEVHDWMDLLADIQDSIREKRGLPAATEAAPV